jgi:hypothetical protein
LNDFHFVMSIIINSSRTVINIRLMLIVLLNSISTVYPFVFKNMVIFVFDVFSVRDLWREKQFSFVFIRQNATWFITDWRYVQ